MSPGGDEQQFFAWASRLYSANNAVRKFDVVVAGR